MPETPKTVWVTKYALEHGIGRAFLSKELSDGIEVNWAPAGARRVLECFKDGEFFYIHEAALARAEQMRSAKIESLQRQVEKLRELRF